MLPPMDDILLPIGRFGRLAGLTIGALRHYHEVGLLVPARVDDETSYRSYSAAQLEDARLIARLRELDLGLAEIRAVVQATAEERTDLLKAHRARLAAFLSRTQRQIHWLNRAIDHEEPIMTTTTTTTTLDSDVRRQLAVELFNHVWTLLEQPDRSPADDDEMLHAAHASRYHWGEVGEPVHLARGEWQCSRVYAVLGRSEPALWHAGRCLALCEEHGFGDFDIAFAWEAIARANRVAGDGAAAERALATAHELAAAIKEDDDRELVLSDLETV